MEVPHFSFGVRGLKFHFWGPRSRVPLKYFGVTSSGSHFGGRGPRISPKHIGVPGVGSQGLTCRRPASRVPIFWYAVSVQYDFLLKSVSKQILITATAINCRIIIDLYDLNSTNQGYQLKV